MSESTFTLTTAAPGPIKIAAPRAVRKTNWLGTIVTTGAFGGGTVAYSLSPDNGTTLIPIKNSAGTAYTATANDYQNVTLGCANNANDRFSIWATLTGSIAGTVNVSVFDNI